MGFLDRLSGKGVVPQGPSATAMVTASHAVDNTQSAGVGSNVEIRENALNQFNLGTIPHDLTLEIRMPGYAPFAVTQRVAVPAKATGRQGYQLPVGVELPIVVTNSNPFEFTIDWKAFLDAPDRKAVVQRAAARESEAKATAYTNLVPGMKEQTWANAHAGLPMWMEAVRAGKMKRKAFNQQVDTLTRIGQMDPQEAAWGKQTLDAEGHV